MDSDGIRKWYTEMDLYIVWNDEVEMSEWIMS